MPELTRFFGIVVRMFAEPLAPHHRPHLHAFYQDQVGIFAIDTVELIGGELPRRQRRLVEAWAEIHHAELLTAWTRLQSGRLPAKIEPLR
jgi:nucleoid-associated protein YgaU